jgi:hypothetical protein
MTRFMSSRRRGKRGSSLAPADKGHGKALQGILHRSLTKIGEGPQSKSGSGVKGGTGGWAAMGRILECVGEARVARSASVETTKIEVTSAGRKPPQHDRLAEVSYRCRGLTEPTGGIVEMKTVPLVGRKGVSMARRNDAEMARKRQMSAAAERALARSSIAQASRAAFSPCPRGACNSRSLRPARPPRVRAA